MTESLADDELVAAAIQAAETDPESWWVTKFGTVLILSPAVVLWVRGGRWELKFGVGMPPVFDKDDIAEIPISRADADRLWETFKKVTAAQLKIRREKALASVGR